jgi:hypothetical protein
MQATGLLPEEKCNLKFENYIEDVTQIQRKKPDSSTMIERDLNLRDTCARPVADEG